MEEYLVTINDNKNNGNYTKFVDLIRPKEAKYAYLSVIKFQAAVDTVMISRPNNITLFLEHLSMNSFSNDPNSNNIIPSQIIDSFITTTTLDNNVGGYRAIYNYEANQTNWIKLNISSLSNLRISLKTSSIYLDLINPISYVELPEFPFTLQFKIKFE